MRGHSEQQKIAQLIWARKLNDHLQENNGQFAQSGRDLTLYWKLFHGIDALICPYFGVIKVLTRTSLYFVRQTRS